MNKLVLFDFDGTLTYRDSMLELFRQKNGIIKYCIGFIRYFPSLLGMKLGLVSAKSVKEKLLAFHFSGMSIDEFDRFCQSFAIEVIPSMIRSNGLARFNEHLASGDRVIVISASLESWIKPWTDQHGVELLGTKLDTREGIVTGKISGENCKGHEKVNRLRAHLNIEDYKCIVAYGDSSGDKAMLELADEGYYRFF